MKPTLKPEVEKRFEKEFGQLRDFLMNEYVDVEDAEHMEKEMYSFFANEIHLAEERVREEGREKIISVITSITEPVKTITLNGQTYVLVDDIFSKLSNPKESNQ